MIDLFGTPNRGTTGDNRGVPGELALRQPGTGETPVSPRKTGVNRGPAPVSRRAGQTLDQLKTEAEALYFDLMKARQERDAFKAAADAKQPAITAARERLTMYFEEHGKPPTAAGWRVSRPLYEAHDAAHREAHPFREGARNTERIVKAITDRLKDINMEIGA